MTVGPMSGHSAIPGSAHDGLSRWAVWLAAVVVGVVSVAYTIFGVAWAVGGESAVSDTFIGYLAGFAMLGGLVASLVAFVMAAVAKARHEARALLWLPLTVFPVLLAVVVLVEALWME